MRLFSRKKARVTGCYVHIQPLVRRTKAQISDLGEPLSENGAEARRETCLGRTCLSIFGHCVSQTDSFVEKKSDELLLVLLPSLNRITPLKKHSLVLR